MTLADVKAGCHLSKVTGIFERTCGAHDDGMAVAATCDFALVSRDRVRRKAGGLVAEVAYVLGVRML